MTILTPQQKAAMTRKRNKFLKELEAKRELMRSNPAALAAEIARQIRLDEHPNEEAENFVNGQMHWYQQDWGQFRMNFDLIKKVRGTYYGNIYEVKCPTTGCVAGWATTLAGYAMAIRANDLKATFEPGEVISVSQCNVDGELVNIQGKASSLLDLTLNQSQWLFDGYNHKEQVLWALDKLAANEPLNPQECPFDQEGNKLEPVVVSDN